MKEPQHPLGTAFDKAGDPMEAWRQQQIAALTDQQRQAYDRIARDEERKKEAKAKELEARKQHHIVEEKRKLLLSKRDLALRMLPTRPMKERRAEEMAKAIVEQRNTADIERVAHEGRETLDSHLRQSEQERQKDEQRQQHSQGLRENASDITQRPSHQEFNRAAGQGQQQDRTRHDNVLARAFEKADRQQEQSRPRNRTQEHARIRERGRD